MDKKLLFFLNWLAILFNIGLLVYYAIDDVQIFFNPIFMTQIIMIAYFAFSNFIWLKHVLSKADGKIVLFELLGFIMILGTLYSIYIDNKTVWLLFWLAYSFFVLYKQKKGIIIGGKPKRWVGTKIISDKILIIMLIVVIIAHVLFETSDNLVMTFLPIALIAKIMYLIGIKKFYIVKF
jgi:hypothetical protein